MKTRTETLKCLIKRCLIATRQKPSWFVVTPSGSTDNIEQINMRMVTVSQRSRSFIRNTDAFFNSVAGDVVLFTNLVTQETHNNSNDLVCWRLVVKLKDDTEFFRLLFDGCFVSVIDRELVVQNGILLDVKNIGWGHRSLLEGLSLSHLKRLINERLSSEDVA